MISFVVSILWFLAIVFVSTFFTWGMYLSVMNLMEEKEKLTLTTKCFAYPMAVIGLLADFIYNITVGTIMFMELPKDWLLTMRLDRHLDDKSWRGDVARWACIQFLDPFAPNGRHCNKKKK